MPEASDAVAVHLVAASDDNYAMPLAAMVRSVLDNLAPGYHLHVHVVDGGITEENKARLRASWSDQPATVHWRDASGLLPDVMVSGYMSAAAYLRLLIPELLPAEIDRAIYLDSDLIVLGNIGELWDMPFDGSPRLVWTRGSDGLFADGAAAARGTGPRAGREVPELGCDGDEPALWRERGLRRRCFTILKSIARRCSASIRMDHRGACGSEGAGPAVEPDEPAVRVSIVAREPFDEATYRRTRNSPLTCIIRRGGSRGIRIMLTGTGSITTGIWITRRGGAGVRSGFRRRRGAGSLWRVFRARLGN